MKTFVEFYIEKYNMQEGFKDIIKMQQQKVQKQMTNIRGLGKVPILGKPGSAQDKPVNIAVEEPVETKTPIGTFMSLFKKAQENKTK